MTRARSVFLMAAACVVCGAAGWASVAELDEIVVSGLRQRVALVPSWEPFVAFGLLGALGVIGLWILASRTERGADVGPVVADMVLPWFGLAALVVPFVPVVPDAWPVLQALAGPASWIVWALVGLQMAWVLWPRARVLRTRLSNLSLRTATAVVWLATAVAASGGAARLTSTTLFPSGDEPHYLVIAQSLWRDKDLQIENNHARGDYREYYSRDLDPHFLTRGVDGAIYSVHPVGMPVLVSPVLAAGGYGLVVAFFIGLAATAAALMWRWVVVMTGAAAHATLAWAAIVLSAPFLLNAFTIYPEVPAALAVSLCVTLAMGPAADTRRWPGWVVGVAAATLLWFSTKYAPMSAALVAIAVARRWWPADAAKPRGQTLWTMLPIVGPYALGLAGWFGFFTAYWGSPWPQGPYGSMDQTRLANLVFGAPGLLADQEYGLLSYAPGYLMGALGVWTMVRSPGPMRRRGVELALVFAALLGTVGAFRIWWGGSAVPGRPLVSGLLVLMLPIAVQIGSASAGSARRVAQHLLVWVGVALAGVLVVAQDGLLLNNDRDGTSSLLEWLSPRWQLWNLVPSFTAHEAPRALLDVAVWAGAAGVGGWLLASRRPTARGAAALTAQAVCAVVLALGSIGMRALPTVPTPHADIDLAARGRLEALDSFDRAARPLTISYAPIRVAGAADVVRTLALSVTPGARSAPQPVRVLHNGRFSLPAGRYTLVVRWASVESLSTRQETIALQFGRIGPPLREWRVEPLPGGEWREEIWLPVDAAFIGLRGSPQLERAIAEIRVEPIEVVDAGRRRPGPQVLAAAELGGATVMFHDEAVYPEPGGFWTRGQRVARVTVACPGGCVDGLVLRVHSGRRANHVRLSTAGWSYDSELQADSPILVRVPPAASDGLVGLEAVSTTGFVPMEVDPSLRDRRLLGVWVEVVPATDAPG